MKLYYTDHFPIPLPPGHRFPANKYALLRERLAQNPDPSWSMSSPPAATDEQLLLVHTEEYLDQLMTGTLSRDHVRRLGLPWSPELVLRSRHSTGATLAAAFDALKEGIAINMAGGTHHAFANAPEGFCVFNDTVVAARWLMHLTKIKRALVVDADVHQGNGTAALAAGDESLFTFSIHGAKSFPFVKMQSDLDIALDDAAADENYLAALNFGLRYAYRASKPDIVFYLAGADPFERDRFSRLKISKSGLARRDELVLQFLHSKAVPTVITMAGGYAKNIDETVDIHETTIRLATHFARTWPTS